MFKSPKSNGLFSVLKGLSPDPDPDLLLLLYF